MRFWPFGKKRVEQPIEGAMAESAVPTHLQPFFMQRVDKGNDTQITGDIRCSCGSTSFAAMHSRDDDCVYRLICAGCGQDILLFDARTHGWDALVCHMPGEYLGQGEETEKCESCGGECFEVTVWIEPIEKAEFISCAEGELPEEAWVNAFTWFAAHLTCTRCGKQKRGWADIETA